MAKHDSFIDLKGYERQHNLERQVWYSPIAIGIGLLGLAAAAYTFWNLTRGVVIAPFQLFVGYGAFLLAYFGLLAYYYAYRFRRLKCPGCGKGFQPHVADMSLVQSLEIGGRYYRRPHDGDDQRPWIRLMRMVRACQRCKTFVDCSRFHYETCTKDELYQIEQRAAGW
jgi:hypothetical protein